MSRDTIDPQGPVQARVQPGVAIAIVERIDAVHGVETLEGRITPLLRAARGGCHTITMHAGQYCDEHAHPTESLIYTVSGDWVLCHAGERHHMRAGSLFWFADDAPTGYEVPFPVPAVILIFKTTGRSSNEEMTGYLEGLAEKLAEDHGHGTPFRLDELPSEHPARVFARGLPGALPL